MSERDRTTDILKFFFRLGGLHCTSPFPSPAQSSSIFGALGTFSSNLTPPSILNTGFFSTGRTELKRAAALAVMRFVADFEGDRFGCMNRSGLGGVTNGLALPF